MSKRSEAAIWTEDAAHLRRMAGRERAAGKSFGLPETGGIGAQELDDRAVRYDAMAAEQTRQADEAGEDAGDPGAA